MLLAGLCVLLSCTPETPTQPAVSSERAASTTAPSALATPGASAPVPDAQRQAPLKGLGPCSDTPQGRDDEVAGLVLPSEAVVTSVTPADPLTNVQGYVPMTPVQMRAFYQKSTDVSVISVEDEVFEAEILFEAAGRRVFLKAQGVCELGSVFVAVVSPVGQ